MFRVLLFKAMERFRAQGSLGRKKGTFNFKSKLLGEVKAHIMLDHDDYMPSFICSPKPRWPMSPRPRGWP
ncbi:hypothetical protein DFAR_2810049 [Desulfarculales bacterium]